MRTLSFFPTVIALSLAACAVPPPGDDGGVDATTDGEGTDTGPGDDTQGMKFDVVDETGDGGPGDGSCGCGEDDWSYLWAANADEGTVSKIDTRTVTEVGRYPTHPMGGGNPSRTSVSVDGRAVVVQNRNKPSLVKIWADHDQCDENANGVPGLQTSTGKDDVLPLEQDDCVDWFVEFPGMTVQRPVQWTQGTLTPSCEYRDQKIWTVTGDGGAEPGHCGTDGVWVHRLDGDTGEVEESIHLEEEVFPCADSRGAYGGAVDADGNFWFQGWQTGKLARVQFESLEVDVWDHEGGGYGITVDVDGNPWLTWPLRRFNVESETWDEVPIDNSSGIAQDQDRLMWVTQGNALLWVDPDTLEIGDPIPLPHPELPQEAMPRGIAVDVDNYVWVVRRRHQYAYRIDPSAPEELAVYDGLDTAYTYSDMTGGQLQNVTCGPQEG